MSIIFVGIAQLVGRYCHGGPEGLLVPLWVLSGIPISCVFSFAVRAVKQDLRRAEFD